jgi:hypothetical protein
MEWGVTSVPKGEGGGRGLLNINRKHSFLVAINFSQPTPFFSNLRRYQFSVSQARSEIET